MSFPSDHHGHNPGLTFLGMSGGILALVISLLLVLPMACCGGLFALGVVGAAVEPTPAVSP